MGNLVVYASDPVVQLLEEKFADLESSISGIRRQVEQMQIQLSKACNMPNPFRVVKMATVPRIAEIQVAVANKLNNGFAIPEKGNQRPLTRMRFVVMLLAYECGYSYPVIGRALHQHHTTILHGVKVMRKCELHELEWAKNLEELRRDLKITKAV
jgi:chromosomal replication initiation ATPase DnaA